jgi:glucan phosphoethanolaminetransferase (alkaline phosphatase superfamily)
VAEFTKETVTTVEDDNTVDRSNQREATGSQTIGYLVYFIFGALEILLAFRLILKLLGASASSSFVSAIYNVSQAFIWPFEGIFSKATTQGAETTAVFEPATLVAIIVYSLIAFGIVQVIRILSGEKQSE